MSSDINSRHHLPPSPSSSILYLHNGIAYHLVALTVRSCDARARQDVINCAADNEEPVYLPERRLCAYSRAILLLHESPARSSLSTLMLRAPISILFLSLLLCAVGANRSLHVSEATLPVSPLLEWEPLSSRRPGTLILCSFISTR